MQTIETTVTVMRDGTLTVSVPTTIAPGVHCVVVVIDKTTAVATGAAAAPVGRKEAIAVRSHSPDGHTTPHSGGKNCTATMVDELFVDNKCRALCLQPGLAIVCGGEYYP